MNSQSKLAYMVADNIDCALQAGFTEDQRETVAMNVQSGIDRMREALRELADAADQAGWHKSITEEARAVIAEATQ
jgi:hypothetical protein